MNAPIDPGASGGRSGSQKERETSMSRVDRPPYGSGRRAGRRPGPPGRGRAPADAASSTVAGASATVAPPESDELFVHVAFRGGRREAFVNPDRLVVRCGDFVVVEAERGQDLGRVTVCAGDDIKRRKKQPVRALVRHATPAEIARVLSLAEQDRAAFESCRVRVIHFGLEMKIIDAETQFDGNRITFYFTAERRVDFRELVRDLASIFRTRIELRQVGARDAARRCDGIGPCGRRLCCTGFLHEFDPVTLKMAKEQNLPLNPAKISGSCGRLMCCLNYEAGAYQNARRAAPPAGSRWTFRGGTYTAGRFDVSRYRVPLLNAESGDAFVDLGTFLEEARPLDEAVVLSEEPGRDEPPE
jgi:cell fate regulator YaaT (PSP1 superfamily)